MKSGLKRAVLTVAVAVAAFVAGCGGGQEYDSRKHSGRGRRFYRLRRSDCL
ncbi:hypothetical protein R80B4_01068 [Fibrobacteres bacterium R8-0-B4]